MDLITKLKNENKEKTKVLEREINSMKKEVEIERKESASLE